MYHFESMFYIFCVLITFPSSTYYVCGTVGVDLCHVQSCDFSPKNREPPTPKTQFLHTRNAAITLMEMTETLQKGDREAYLSQLLIGVVFFDYMYSESSSQPST